MEIKTNFLRNNDLGLLLLRVSVGGLMLFHGVHKLIYGVGFIGGVLPDAPGRPGCSACQSRPLSWS